MPITKVKAYIYTGGLGPTFYVVNANFKTKKRTIPLSPMSDLSTLDCLGEGALPWVPGEA